MSKKGREKKSSTPVDPVKEPPSQTAVGFDYSALIPKDIDERSKELLQVNFQYIVCCLCLFVPELSCLFVQITVASEGCVAWILSMYCG